MAGRGEHLDDVDSADVAMGICAMGICALGHITAAWSTTVVDEDEGVEDDEDDDAFDYADEEEDEDAFDLAGW